MATAIQGINILDDEKAYDENPFDMFTLPPKEVHKKGGKTITIASSIPITDAGPYKFGIKSQSDEYTMMNFGRLEGECRIVDKNGEDLIAQDVSICNLFPNSIFKSVELSAYGVEVRCNFLVYLLFHCFGILRVPEPSIRYAQDSEEVEKR